MTGSVIVGFTATGKTTFVNTQYAETLRRRNKDIVTDLDLGLGKDSPEVRETYIREVNERTSKGYHVLMPAHPYVLETLIDHGVSFTLFLPDMALREEYLGRVVEREASLSFLSYYYEKWYHNLERLMRRYAESAERVIYLKAGETISDYLEIMDDDTLHIREWGTNMEMIEPWKIQIAKALLTDVDLDRMSGEIFSTPLTGSGEDQELLSPDTTPYSWEIRDTVFLEKAIEYVRRAWGLELKKEDITVNTWISWGNNNQGIELHTHESSHLTSVFYLSAAPSDLILADPRTNAGRGYPYHVRKKAFANHHISPEDGLLVMFPCYIPHYVPPNPGVHRVALVTDFYISHNAGTVS